MNWTVIAFYSGIIVGWAIKKWILTETIQKHPFERLELNRKARLEDELPSH